HLRLQDLALRVRPLVTGLVLASLAIGARAEQLVNDLPGGPQVRGIDLQRPVTRIAEGQQDLHVLLLWICSIIFVLVFGVMFYSIFKHRKSKGAKPAGFHESTTVEVAWTIVPFLIVIGM